MRNFAPLSNRGFTLIEILVATVILGFASLLVYNVIIGSFETNRKLTTESDAMLSISIAMQALDRDISQIFSPQVGSVTPPQDNTPGAYWSAPQRADGLRRMRLTGSKERISFISASNRRLQIDARESELAKIVYKIVQDKDGSYSVVREVYTDVFDYEDRESSANISDFKILEKLTSAEFSFYRADKEKWENQWDSEAPYTEDISRFPNLIALEIQYPSPDNSQAILKWRSEFSPILKLNAEVALPTTPGASPQ